MSRAPTPDDFAVLGLRPSADQAGIRDAYRRLAKLNHPDRNPGDPVALATFHQLTESYTALREHPGVARARGRTPLSAAQASRRRPAPKSASALVALADLAVGGALWVAADAVLAGPDRVAALRPSAWGSPFPSAERVIRVERRGEGHHVFMPPQPSARWAVGATAETEGMTVAALWVGDRQDGDLDSGSAARLPLRLITRTVGEMAIDDRGWVALDALAVDSQGAWTVDLAQPVSQEPHRATPLRVLRDADGYRVHSDLHADRWEPADRDEGGRAQVVTLMLGGVAYPVPPADGA